ncbi:MAG TPA: PQQ-dependent sugar dehydrogenase [Candidatus Xenobia bacterium]|nr:PQQ-dependent sugar dehydrogenase [Candidatus Xenobia bacterium]
MGVPPAAGQDPGAPAIALQPIVTGLSRPIDITNAGDGSNRLFIAQKNGVVRIYNPSANPSLLATPFIDISTLIVAMPGDTVGNFEGLLGIAFHPNYETNGRFYLCYVTTAKVWTLARFTVSMNDPNVANPQPDRILLTIQYPSLTFPHYGGQIQFGPEGYLYASTGDGGEGADPEPAQQLNSLLGKVLRLDADTGNPYGIPPTNPFVNTPGARGEIWARGLRNPWRFSFDRMTDELFLTDVGESSREEVDVQPVASPGGENYGWPRMEGSVCFNPLVNCNDGTLTLPAFDYSHTQDSCSGSISGGYRYRGSLFPQLTGMYIYSDFCRHDVRGAFQLSDGSWKQMLLVDLNATFPPSGFNIVGYGEDEAGEVYTGGYFEGRIYRVTSSDNPVPVLTQLAPASAAAGGSGFTLVATGSNFKVNSTVRWNGSERTTLFVSDTQLQATIPAGDLAVGGLKDVTVFTPPNGGGASNSLSFTVTPLLDPDGTVNAASFAPAAGVAPGSIAATFGTGLAAATATAGSVPLPTTLGGAALLFNGSMSVPEFFASPGQVNVQIPWELAGQGSASLTDTVGGVTSGPESVPLAAFAPGLFATNQQGTGQGAILIANTPNLAAPVGMFPGSRPAVRGVDFLEIYCTGLGPVTNQPATGAAAPANPLSQTTSTPTVTVGGVPATVLFSGLAPPFVGLYVVTLQVPADAPTGNSVPVVLTIGGIQSNAVTIAIQ